MADKNNMAAKAEMVSLDATNWEDYIPKAVEFEDTMGAQKVQQTWTKMMIHAGYKSPSEKQQRAFRAACYVYACMNGTSREGNYRGTIVTADGHQFEAAVIPRATGKMQIRQFFRGNMVESYNMLKNSKVMEHDERFVAKAASLGIAAEDAFAMADWLGDCPMFTSSEQKAHNKSFTVSVERARRARDGHVLEDVEDERVQQALESQGSMEPAVRGRNLF